jgi:hypothetical protein
LTSAFQITRLVARHSWRYTTQGEGSNVIRTRTLLVAVISAAVFVGASASAASAGEITGNGKPTAGPAHANSICVFSGQNDDPTAPLSLDRTIAPNGPGGRSQSFGQDVKLGLDPHVLNPGMACGPGSNPDRLK